jgi:hypothetical protein
MFNFKPADEIKAVPFFDDVKAADGWQGHTTSKNIDKLLSEIAMNLTRLGCIFSGCRAGTFGDRLGYQIHFAMKSEDGRTIPSRLDIACLPINPRRRFNRTRRMGRGSKDPRIEGTQKMALYMTSMAIKGMYFLSVLSPAFIPFMSAMLNNKNETLGSIWISHGSMAALMPPDDSEFVDGQVLTT